jgi:hypothetical protein
MTIHNWGIEYCKSYAEQLRDKTCVTRAVHAAECIEYLLSLVQKEWVGLTAKDLVEIPSSCYEGAIWADAKLKEKNT